MIADQAGPWSRAKSAFERIAGISVGVAGVTAGLSTHARRTASSVLDPGTLADALDRLASEVRKDAPNGGLLITVDEVQVASHADLALLAATLQRLNVDHPQSAVVFAGTGLPHTPEVLRAAGVTHLDRLFLLEQLSVTLTDADAAYAIVEPARRVGVSWHPDAAVAVVKASGGHPAHLQQFAHTMWTTRAGPGHHHRQRRNPRAPTDRGRPGPAHPRPRWDRMADRQMEYLAALAVHESRATNNIIATTLGRSAQELSWIRQDLIREGDIYAPQRGQVTLAVPIFAPYILAHYEQGRTTADRP